MSLFKRESDRRKALASAYVVPESVRCVQCGICTYNCPLGVDVRLHAWQGQPIEQSECLSCGECIQRCPRGVLRFEASNIFDMDGDR
jgi:heterodisulfide reductase subunit C